MSTQKTLEFYPTRGSLRVSARQHWRIAVSDNATASEKYAAEEFQKWFNQATRLTLPLDTVHENTDTNNGWITIKGSSMLGDEDIEITVSDSQIQIKGGRPRGILYAVYQFLEELIGVRFLTADHTYIPDASTRQIPYGSYIYSPPFSFRWSYYRENSEDPTFAAKRKVNTVTDAENLGGKTQQQLINHSFHALVPYSTYGESHPEYYALVDGKRDMNTHGGGPQLCVTNPEVIEVAAASAIQQLTDRPEATNISVSQADTAAYCRCEACETLNEAEDSPMGSQLTFVNAVAERIEKAHPHVKVGTLAYWYTRKPPQTIKPRHNVQIQLCSIECCTLHAIDNPDCEQNRAFCQDTNEWGKICDDIWIWNYNTNFRSYDLPFPNLRSIAPNVRYFLRNNAKGVFMQANGNGLSGEFSDLRNYLISHLIWDPHLDADALLNEFVNLHYEAAAPAILEYITFLHDNVETRGLHPRCFPTPEDVGLDAESAQAVFDYFQQALALADKPEIRARVEKAAIPAYKAMLVAGGEMPSEERLTLIDEYIALCERYNMSHAAETQAAEAYFEELRSQ
ncbi:MAG: DUF4838 domain-containing protein [Candidatus Poribacteria bacterium]|nr:DUF4838 domain-containing protein [Candidatus Poribacteria bacterium]